MMKTGMNKTIAELITGLETSLDKKLKDWKSLKEDLKKRRLADYEQVIEKISLDQAERILPIMKKLEERFSYGIMFSEVSLTGGSKVQFDRITELSKAKGDVCDMLDSLADAGYTLNEYKDKNKEVIKYVTPKDITLFKRLIEKDAYKNFYGIIKTLRNALGYENKTQSSNYNAEIENLIGLTKIKGDVAGAICLLAEEGYKIRKEIGLTENHVETIEYITRTILKEPEISTLYLYKRLKPEMFEEYFSSISKEKQKELLGRIFESDYQNEEIIKWLDEAHPDIMREVSFED